MVAIRMAIVFCVADGRLERGFVANHSKSLPPLRRTLHRAFSLPGEMRSLSNFAKFLIREFRLGQAALCLSKEAAAVDSSSTARARKYGRQPPG